MVMESLIISKAGPEILETIVDLLRISISL